MTKIITTSWDDGYILDIRLAKLLKKYKISGTFYISPNNREWNKKDLLSSVQIKQLNKDFEIGAHTMTHPSLTEIDNDQAYKEIRDSKTYLENLSKKEIKMFCYPKGLFNNKIKAMVKDAKFLGARIIGNYKTAPPKDFYQFGTTLHPFTRNLNYNIRLALINNPRFIPFLLKNNDWVSVSKKTFDYVNKHGGIWHLWYHSWEIEEKNLWGQLEEVLKYVSNNSDFLYFTNGETLEYFKEGQP